MNQASEERYRGNCMKNGCAHVSPNGAECRGCGFDAGEFKRRRALPLVQLPNGLRGKVVRQETEANAGQLRGEKPSPHQSPAATASPPQGEAMDGADVGRLRDENSTLISQPLADSFPLKGEAGGEGQSAAATASPRGEAMSAAEASSRGEADGRSEIPNEGALEKTEEERVC